MRHGRICRLGVFYDGTYFAFAQQYFYHQRKLGWLDYRDFQLMLQEYARSREQGYDAYKVVYAAWFQGMGTSTQMEERHLRHDRNRHHNLMHAGIDMKYLPLSTTQGEKGVDVALAVDAMQIGLGGKIDIAVLVSGDGDFVPLVRELMKNGVRVMVAYFDYETEQGRSFANDRLLAAANYVVDVNDLEHDKDFRSLFQSMFYRG